MFTRLCEFREPAKKLTQLHMEAMLLEAFLSMRDHFAVKTAYRDYYENCRIGAFFFIYLTWLENGCRESPDELCALVRQIVQKTRERGGQNGGNREAVIRRRFVCPVSSVIADGIGFVETEPIFLRHSATDGRTLQMKLLFPTDSTNLSAAAAARLIKERFCL